MFNYDNTNPPVTNSDNIFLFYNNNANPIVGEITTSFDSNLQFGTPAPAGQGATFTTIENLAVFETEPVESKLDIIWETT